MTWLAVIETIEKFWLQFVLSGVSGLIVMLWKKLNQVKAEQKKARSEQKAEDETIKQAVKALLSDRLLQSCEYFIEHGYVTDVALKNILKMNTAYQTLGDGDPSIEILVNEVRGLPKKIHRDE